MAKRAVGGWRTGFYRRLVDDGGTVDCAGGGGEKSRAGSGEEEEEGKLQCSVHGKQIRVSLCV